MLVRPRAGRNPLNPSCFGLTAPPFDNTPDLRFYFPAAAHEAALERMVYAVEGRKGALLVVGRVGSGKTLLTRALIARLPAARYDVALVTNPALPAAEFLDEILHQFGIQPPGDGVGAGRRALEERLLRNLREEKDTLLVVDEVQAVRDPVILEDLRLLLNFQLNERFLLNLCLVGQPEALELVQRSPALAQRIAVRVDLPPLSAGETAAYIRHRLAAAGGSPALFDDAAVAEIARRAGGIPRLVNSLCDACLFEADRAGLLGIDARLAQRVAAERGGLGT